MADYPLTLEQLNDWEAYSQQYGYRNDLLFGYLTYATIANDKVQLRDCMPYRGEPTSEELYEQACSFFPSLRK